MKLNEIAAPRGMNRKRKKKGRGSGSGHGKTSGRGHKGALARSGTATRPGFEGGQMPLMRRLPKRGFTAPFRWAFQPVNVEQLNRFAKNSVVGPEELKKAGCITSVTGPVKILGDGKLAKELAIRAHACSAAARKKIEAAGGTIEFLKK